MGSEHLGNTAPPNSLLIGAVVPVLCHKTTTLSLLVISKAGLHQVAQAVLEPAIFPSQCPEH